MEVIDEKGNSKRYYSADESKRIISGVLGILFGSLGIHKFVLGYTKQGLLMLILSVVSFGILAGLTGLIGLIEGIIYLTKSDQEFVDIYQNNRKNWF
ncbi:NINE protein [Urechidicola sp. KH5]